MSVDSDCLTPDDFEREGKLADSEGFDVIVADDFTLLLDLDQKEFSLFDFMNLRPYEKIDDLWGVKEVDYWPSKGGNWHVRVVLHTSLSVEQRLILEATLGSDPIRAVLSLARWRNGVNEPSRLFKPNTERQKKINDELWASIEEVDVIKTLAQG